MFSVFVQKIIDDVLPKKNLKLLIIEVLFLSFLLVTKMFVNLIRDNLLLKQSYSFNKRINFSFYKTLLYLPKSFFDTRKTGDLVCRLNDIQRIQQVLKTIVSSSIIDFLIVLISICFLFIYSWKVAIIASIAIPFFCIVIFNQNKKIVTGHKNVMITHAINESHYISTIKGIEAIKNNNKQLFFIKLNNVLFSQFQDKVFELGKINIKLIWFLNIINTFFILIIFIYTSALVITNKLHLGELFAILGIVNSLFPSITNLALISIPLNEAKVAFNRMFEFTSLKKEQTGNNKIEEIHSIAINNAFFRFPGRMSLFENLNLTLIKGNITALIGKSGQGKSTVSQILQAFYEIESGQISINNISLNQININNYRSKVGVVPQNIHLFNGTILENILLGEQINTTEFNEFAQKYKFDSFFSQFPLGINTLIGEEGINLSGGQVQILALARILYRKPQFIILDEITSSMDFESESFIISILKIIKTNTIILFITHRLYSLNKFIDTIAILENGTITIQDSPKNLLLFKNMYSEFINYHKQ